MVSSFPPGEFIHFVLHCSYEIQVSLTQEINMGNRGGGGGEISIMEEKFQKIVIHSV